MLFWTYILILMRIFHCIGLFTFTSFGRRGSHFASKRINGAITACPHIPLQRSYQLITDTLGWADFESVNWKGKEGVLALWLYLDEAGGAHWQHLKSACVTALVLCAVQHSLRVWLSPRCENSSWFAGVCTWALESSTWSCPCGCQCFC